MYLALPPLLVIVGLAMLIPATFAGDPVSAGHVLAGVFILCGVYIMAN